MNAKDALAPLLETLGASMDTELELDAEGICLLENEDGVECEVSALPESTDFLLTSLVGEVRDGDGEPFYVDLLSLAGEVGETFGAAIGLDRDAGLLMLHQMHSVRGLDQQAFDELIEDFYSLTLSLSQVIQSRRIAPTTDESAPEERAGATPTGGGDAPWQRV